MADKLTWLDPALARREAMKARIIQLIKESVPAPMPVACPLAMTEQCPAKARIARRG